MELTRLINELISKLDEDNDSILIELLKFKINNIKESYLSKHSVSEYELRNIKIGFIKTYQTWDNTSWNTYYIGKDDDDELIEKSRNGYEYLCNNPDLEYVWM